MMLTEEQLQKARDEGRTYAEGFKAFSEGLLQERTEGFKRVFETGASRDTEQGKLDYEGFLSPTVLKRYAEYMHKHRQMSDGSLRDSDNWQKGIPREVYMKSMWRHFMDLWSFYRQGEDGEAFEESACALLFNVMGVLHEVLKD